MSLKMKLQESVDFIRENVKEVPGLGIVLGSGLGAFAERLENRTVIPYAAIPHFRKTAVSGHKGNLVFGSMNGISLAVLQGRFHFYEGHELEEVVYPVRLLAFFGVPAVLLTNAAGGIREDLDPGDIVIIRDHLNLLFRNPLTGMEALEVGPRFIDMTAVYDPDLSEKLEKAFNKSGIRVKKGVYACLSGPSYETPSEIRMLKALGADLVGMSTVPEAIALRQMGVKTAALSVVTNKAAGISQKPLSHSEVEETGRLSERSLLNLLSEFIKLF